jgi:hypothetical protein
MVTTSEALPRLKRALLNGTVIPSADVAELIEDYKALELAYLALFNAPCRHCGMTPEQAKL